MENKVTLYSTHCSHCKVVTMMLQKKNIEYEEVYINPDKPEEIQVMLDMGLKSAPGLVVNGKVMNFTEAVNWIKEQ